MSIARQVLILGATSFVFFATACGDGGSIPAGSDAEAPALVSVSPPGNAMGVSLSGRVIVEFSHPMAQGMEEYASVHREDLAAPPVNGTWSWSPDHRVMTFMPVHPFDPATTYIVHLGGGMMDAQGRWVDFQRHGASHMGGQWATEGMMGGWTGGPVMGGGMWNGQPDGGHMGNGWRQTDGTYGMVFAFRTAG